MESKARVLANEGSCKEQQEMTTGLVKGNGVRAISIIGKFFNAVDDVRLKKKKESYWQS